MRFVTDHEGRAQSDESADEDQPAQRDGATQQVSAPASLGAPLSRALGRIQRLGVGSQAVENLSGPLRPRNKKPFVSDLRTERSHDHVTSHRANSACASRIRKKRR
jgi:hypothetical protein